MQFVNFVGQEDVMHTAEVAVDDAAYLRRVITKLRPLSEEDYMNGPAVVLHTLAKWSYVLDGHQLYWCVEWAPGLIVVRFSPNEPMAWAAIRSPVPNFGGRETTDADWVDFDDDAENPQYNLIFNSWDSQFDARDREYRSFVPADFDVQLRFEMALARVNELGDIMEQRFADNRVACGNAGFVALTFAALSTLARMALFPSVFLFSVLADRLSGFLASLLLRFVVSFLRAQETQTVSFHFLARDWRRCFSGLVSRVVGGAGSRSGPRKQNARAAVDATARAAPPESYLPWDNSSITRRTVAASFRSGFACGRTVAGRSFRFDTTSGIAPIPPVVNSSAAGRR
jgi:hypothetical protein